MGDRTLTTVLGDDIKFSSSIQNLSNEKALYGPSILVPLPTAEIFSLKRTNKK